jgi:hypothetical protein
MSIINKTYIKYLRKLFLIMGMVTAISGIDSAMAQIPVRIPQKPDESCIYECNKITAKRTVVESLRYGNANSYKSAYYCNVNTIVQEDCSDHGYDETPYMDYYTAQCSFSNGKGGTFPSYSIVGKKNTCANLQADCNAVKQNYISTCLATCQGGDILAEVSGADVINAIRPQIMAMFKDPTVNTPAQKTAAEILTEMDGTNLAKKVIENLNYQQVYDVNRVFE